MGNESWDMNQERVFIENLFCQRFNFFIVIFSLVIAGAASTNSQIKFITLLWVGFALCTLVGMTLYRAWVKLDWILRALHADATHPIAVTARGIEQGRLPTLIGVNPIIGIVIPGACNALLLVGAVLASYGCLNAS